MDWSHSTACRRISLCSAGLSLRFRRLVCSARETSFVWATLSILRGAHGVLPPQEYRPSAMMSQDKFVVVMVDVHHILYSYGLASQRNCIMSTMSTKTPLKRLYVRADPRSRHALKRLLTALQSPELLPDLTQ